MTNLILATNNPGKIKEFQAMLSPIQCLDQGSLGISEAEETGLSFIENALIKARHASLYSKKPALGDDSGLVVPALDGAPGIFSARFAGVKASAEDNMKLLLEQMSALQGEHRKAYFYCALVLMKHAKDPTPLIATGIFKGEIGTARLGSNGFGYDPLFYCPEYQCTAAQLPPEIKNKISHRAQALSQLIKLMDLS